VAPDVIEVDDYQGRIKRAKTCRSRLFQLATLGDPVFAEKHKVAHPKGFELLTPKFVV
jgi:hypothetical protein